MALLSVNLNKVATLRNTRTIGIPSVTRAAHISLQAGAHGITIHPRPDQRHIRHDDVGELAALLRNYPGREFNIEGNPFHDYMPFARQHRPTQCTLVPDDPQQSTSNRGWELNDATRRQLQPVVDELKLLGCRVSLFVSPDLEQITRAAAMGVQRIELYTEPYAAAFARGEASAVGPYAKAAEHAKSLGLAVNAGHDLNLLNLPPLVKRIPYLAEVSIGHALIADALEFGLDATVRKYIAAATF